MNILITGVQASGKSVIAQALKEYYKNRNEDALVYDDEQYTDSIVVGEAQQKTAQDRMVATKGNHKTHTICVVQDASNLAISPKLLDYYIQTSKAER